ncbi:MAG: SPOR domain-containing protein, partial [Kiloniellaceae bacterium]
AEAPARLPEPSFDIIRIEPDGQSIIAGRAQPHSAWILLNNGSPIATVQADANGEWVVLPDASLVPGANAFSLVPKTERGKVAIPAPVSSSSSGTSPDSAPGAQQRPSEAAVPQGAPLPGESGPDVALPKPKPEAAIPAATPAVPTAAFRVSPDGVYEVQVASVREVADAERERGRLAASFPMLLGALDLRVQEASVEGAGTFFRVRSGAIADLGVARELCRQLEAAGQGCLVVRRTAVPEAPNVEAVAKQATEPAADGGSAAQQQAERPQ